MSINNPEVEEYKFPIELGDDSKPDYEISIDTSLEFPYIRGANALGSEVNLALFNEFAEDSPFSRDPKSGEMVLSYRSGAGSRQWSVDDMARFHRMDKGEILELLRPYEEFLKGRLIVKEQK